MKLAMRPKKMPMRGEVFADLDFEFLRRRLGQRARGRRRAEEYGCADNAGPGDERDDQRRHAPPVARAGKNFRRRVEQRRARLRRQDQRRIRRAAIAETDVVASFGREGEVAIAPEDAFAFRRDGESVGFEGDVGLLRMAAAAVEIARRKRGEIRHQKFEMMSSPSARPSP